MSHDVVKTRYELLKCTYSEYIYLLMMVKQFFKHLVNINTVGIVLGSYRARQLP